MEEVEADVASDWAPTGWLEEWQALVRQMRPSDELWEYYGEECGPPEPDQWWHEHEGKAGYAITRATRIAKLSPGTTVRVEVIDNLPIPVGSFRSIGDLIP